jgi:hypothetical protein
VASLLCGFGDGARYEQRQFAACPQGESIAVHQNLLNGVQRGQQSIAFPLYLMQALISGVCVHDCVSCVLLEHADSLKPRFSVRAMRLRKIASSSNNVAYCVSTRNDRISNETIAGA